MESLSVKLELSGTSLGAGYILPICSKRWSFSLSLQKNQKTILIIKMFLKGVHLQAFTVKLFRNMVSFLLHSISRLFIGYKQNKLYSFILHGIKFWPPATWYHNNWQWFEIFSEWLLLSLFDVQVTGQKTCL